jgi:single-strand DNA-binding protein
VKKIFFFILKIMKEVLNMADLNKVMLIGRLVADPELKTTTNGTAVANIRLAVGRRKIEGQPDVDFLNIVVWSKLAEICGQYLKKGSQAMFEGRIQTRSYEKEGAKVYITEVVAENMQMLGGKSSTDKAEKVPATVGASVGATDDLPF